MECPRKFEHKYDTSVSFVDRMKSFEKPVFFNPDSFVIIRIDGRAFHTLTKNCQKPFDEHLSNSLRWAALDLAKDIGRNCRAIYQQSDEISIVLYRSGNLEPWFNYNKSKLESISSSIITERFASYFGRTHVSFDARAFEIPEHEVHNYFIWRQADWVRNRLSMIARQRFSQKELQGKKMADVQTMIFNASNDLNNYGFKFGWTYVRAADGTMCSFEDDYLFLAQREVFMQDIKNIGELS